MRVEIEHERMIKTADTDSDRARLAREARMLRRSAHPGVVALAEVPVGGPVTDRLVLRRVDGCRLSDVGPQVVEVVAGWGAALATTVADLHELGCFHGRIDADHVLIDRGGRPVLAGFGSAVAAGDPAEQRSLARADIAALAALVVERLPGTLDRRLMRALRRARAGGRGAPGARTLARLLVERVPGARLAAEDDPAGAPPPDAAPSLDATPAGSRTSSESGIAKVARTPRAGVRATAQGRPTAQSRPGRPTARVGPAVRDPRVVAALSVTAVAAAGLIGAMTLSGGGAGRLRHPVAGVPQDPAGVAHHPGITVAVGAPPGIAGRFELTVSGAERPVVAVGRWGCGPDLPAVLDTRTGTVWVLPSWPGPGRSVRGNQLARVPGASSLMARPGGPACDQLVALRGDAPIVIAAGVGR